MLLAAIFIFSMIVCLYVSFSTQYVASLEGHMSFSCQHVQNDKNMTTMFMRMRVQYVFLGNKKRKSTSCVQKYVISFTGLLWEHCLSGTFMPIKHAELN